jgi:hypothetical protein
LNNITTIKVPYQDPSHFIENISQICSLENLCLPDMENKDVESAGGVLEFSSASEIRKLTLEARKATGNPECHVIGIPIFDDDATSGKRGCRTSSPVSYSLSIFASKLFHSTKGMYFFSL